MDLVYPHADVLSSAIKNGNLAAVQKILDLRPVPADGKFLDYKFLVTAVREKQVDIVKLFVEDKNFRIQNDIENGETPMHRAIESRSFEITKILLKKGVLIEGSHFCIAIVNQSFRILNLLFSHCDVSKLDLNNSYDVAPFFLACMTGNLLCLEKFLDHRFFIDTCLNVRPVPSWHILSKNNGYTGLHIAVKYQNSETIKYLLSRGADLSSKNAQGLTPFQLTVESMTDCIFHDNLFYQEIIELLTVHGAARVCIDSKGNMPLHCAFQMKRYEIIDLLFSDKVVAETNLVNNTGLSYFHIACTTGNKDLVENYIRKGVDVNASVKSQCNEQDFDWHGYTPLHLAVLFNRLEIVRLLLRHNADVHATNLRGFTALHLACQYTFEKFYQEMRSLLAIWKLGEFSHEIRLDFTPLPVCDCSLSVQESSDSSTSGEESVIDSLVDWSSHRKQQIEIIKLLLKSKCNINSLNEFGNGPLFYAYYLGTDEILNQTPKKFFNNTSRSLLKRQLEDELYTRRRIILQILDKYSPNIKHCYVFGSILNYTVQKFKNSFDKERAKILESFLQKGVNPNIILNKKKWSLLHRAIELRSNELVRILINYNANVDSIEPSCSLTPLLVACKIHPSERIGKIIELLLDKGANVNAKDCNGMTGLHFLAQKNVIIVNEFILIEMMKTGAQVDNLNLKKRTALHEAVSNKCPNMVKDLLRFGSDINVQDQNGNTVLCYAYKYVSKYLKSVYNGLDGPTFKIIKELEDHYVKTHMIGLPVSDKVKCTSVKLVRKCNRISQYYNPHLYNNWLGYGRASFEDYLDFYVTDDYVATFSEKCNEEKERLKCITIDNFTNLHDVIFKSDHDMMNVIKNEIFKEFLRSKIHVHDKKFEIYAYLFKLQFNKGMTRKTILEHARESMRLLAHLPDLCSDYIFQYLTNNELINFVLAISVLSSRGQEINSRMCMNLRKFNYSYNIGVKYTRSTELTNELMESSSDDY